MESYDFFHHFFGAEFSKKTTCEGSKYTRGIHNSFTLRQTTINQLTKRFSCFFSGIDGEKSLVIFHFFFLFNPKKTICTLTLDIEFRRESNLFGISLGYIERFHSYIDSAELLTPSIGIKFQARQDFSVVKLIYL